MATIHKEYPDIQVGNEEATWGTSQFTTPKMIIRSSAQYIDFTRKHPGDSFVLGYSTVSPQSVIGIWRQAGFFPEIAPSFEQTYKSFVEKYGTPSFVERKNRYGAVTTGAKADSTHITAEWFLQGAAPDAKSQNCPYYQEQAEQGGGMQSQPADISRMRKCGLYLRVLMNANTDRPSLLQGFEVHLADTRLLANSIENIQNLVKQGSAAAQAHDAARNAKPHL